jgi:hypothetical protein
MYVHVCVCVHVLLTELWSCLVKPKKIFSLKERENERERESERVGREERTRRQIEAAMVTVWRFHDTIYRTGCGAAFISVITAAVACCSVAVTERRAKRVGPQTGTTNSPLYKLQCCLRGPPCLPSSACVLCLPLPRRTTSRDNKIPSMYLLPVARQKDSPPL